MSVRVTRTAQASWQGDLPSGGGRIGVGQRRLRGPVHAARPGGGRGALDQPGGADRRRPRRLLHDVPGQPAERIGPPARPICNTTAHVRLEQLDTGFAITRIALETVGEVPGVDAETFARLAQQAKDTCPVSRALAGTEITLEARLAGH